MLWTTACTDYDEDIRDLNNKIDDIHTSLVQGQIEPLKADLARVEKQLRQALADMEANLKVMHDQDIARLQNQINNVNGRVDAANQTISALDAALSKLATDHQNLARTLKQEIARLESEYKKADDALKGELAQQIVDAEQRLRNHINSNVSALYGEIGTLRNDMYKRIEDAFNAINAANKEIDALDLRVDQEVANLKTSIQDTNDRLTQTEKDLAAAEQSLEQAINAEKKAREDGDTELANKLSAEVSAREAAVKALESAISALESKLDSEVSQLNQAIKDAKEALEKAIQDEADARQAGDKQLADDLNKEVQERKAAVAALEEDLKDLEDKLDRELNLLKHTDAALAQQLAGVQAGLESLSKLVDANYNTLTAEMVALEGRLQAQIDQHTSDIAKNAFNINKLTNDLASVNGKLDAVQLSMQQTNVMLANHMAAFAQYQSIVEGRLAYLEATAAQLADAIDDLKNNVIPGIEDQILANNALIEQNISDIAANAKALEDYKAAAAKTFDLMQQGLNDLWSAIAMLNTKVYENDAKLTELNNKFLAYQTEIETELNDKFAALSSQIQTMKKQYADDTAALKEELMAIKSRIEANKNALASEIANREAADKDLKNALEVLKLAYTNKVIELEDSINGLDQRLTTIETAFAEYKEQVKTMISNAVAEAVKSSNQYTDTKVGELKVDIEGQIDDLDTKLSKEIEDAKDAAEQALKTAVSGLQTQIDEINDKIDDLQDGFSALKGRIQSLVFVPEYEDGKATIEYAKVGTNNIDAQSVLLYQVYPANCAVAIEKEDLEFVFSDALKTRAANPSLEVVKVEEYALKPGSGIIAVTVKAHDLQEVYATDNAKYAVSLVFNGKSNGVDTNVASSYTVLHREKDTEVSNISWALNTGYTTSNKIEYIATNSVEVLSGINVEFDVDGNAKTTAEIEAEYGLKVAPKTSYVPTYSADTYVSALDAQTKNSKDVFKNTVREDNGYDVSIALATPDKATVGLVQSIEYGFTLSNLDGAVLDELKDVATVEITKIKGYMTLDPQTITWARSMDNEADLITPKAPTSRLVATVAGKLVNANGEELATAGTTYADIIAGVAAITVDGVDLASTSYNVVFGKDASNAPTVLFEGFEWNKTYDIVAAYEIDNIIAEVSIKLTTEQKSSVVTLDPSTITWNYAADKASELGADTFRAVAANADDATLYADVIANGALVSITPATGFVFTATGFEATAFAWNSNYDVEALYAMDDQLVTVKVAVETVKDAFADLTIDLTAEDWKYNAAFASTGVFETANEALATVHSQLTNLGDITAADYLTDIFVTYAPTLTATANNVALANTKLVVAADGQNINAVYDINDFTIAPEKVEYVLTVDTWYGQKITFKKTLNIGLKKVVLALAEETKDIAKNLVFTTDAESLAALHAHADVQRYLDGSYVADADAFLTEVLVSKTTNLYAVNANTVNAVAMPNSLFTHNGVEGQVSYNYNDFTATPDALSYVYNVTTWYGQEFEITKVVNIKKDIRTYDFFHVNTWVYEAPYYSQITPEYTYLNEALMNATAFSLANVKLNDAFLVKDAAMTTLDDAALTALGLSIEFKTKNPAFSSMITAPTVTEPYWAFTYGTKETSVGISGHIYLETGIPGEVLELPTQFSEPNGLYKDYYIKGFQPIADTMKVNDKDVNGNDLKITKLIEAKEYKTSVWSLLSIKDKRGFELFGYDATDNYGWVAGNDNNGFASTKNPSMPAIYDATMEFSIVSIENLPAEQTGKVNITSGSGILTFDYTNKFSATKPIKVTVKASLTYRYGTVKDETLVYTFMTE